MAGTWPTARAALKAQLDGVTASVAGHEAETLDALEYAPGGRQDAQEWPYGFFLPVGEVVTREPGNQRITTKSPVFRVMLAPRGQSSDMESLHKRYDAWKEALKDALDDAVAADGNADVFLTQEFGDLAFFEDVDVGWGFDMTFGELQLSETKTFGP
ncbi:hypothetical protein UFOVP1383_32 [uncultured Caudovirales phage]|uniref:Uncharacterized protein n=1 Tax=uncultured Caudovirales phage TaxID=2100421 RepID=A0A6J5PBL4_9CAUD|nr:hypothetical protein UFOVP848_9 [uncultured Caudovirales phage]CAB4173414.1 hypothetical protein UFOVP945_56 [uncultured Caudovirales phage]CAB4179673.1 hypothetical protein UFOVP1023_45 [uncultured Caudovirales phage]CAB4204123.1 hypothetical protein UFOVP1383_32 [uncultured Caudovirales phage]CAB4215868.1 hypothetical protein UFOVP1477_16 [uncultured Caudovirales phage]